MIEKLRTWELFGHDAQSFQSGHEGVEGSGDAAGLQPVLKAQQSWVLDKDSKAKDSASSNGLVILTSKTKSEASKQHCFSLDLFVSEQHVTVAWGGF